MSSVPSRLSSSIHMPSVQEYAVKGVIVKIEEAPRENPEDTVQQDFWNRKMMYALHVQIVGNPTMKATFLTSAQTGRWELLTPASGMLLRRSSSSTGSAISWWLETLATLCARPASPPTVVQRLLIPQRACSTESFLNLYTLHGVHLRQTWAKLIKN
jgi:hypothetical protein